MRVCKTRGYKCWGGLSRAVQFRTVPLGLFSLLRLYTAVVKKQGGDERFDSLATQCDVGRNS